MIINNISIIIESLDWERYEVVQSKNKKNHQSILSIKLAEYLGELDFSFIK